MPKKTGIELNRFRQGWIVPEPIRKFLQIVLRNMLV